MNTYPLWLKLLVAFGLPFSTTLAASWHEHLGHTLASAFATGFGGLSGLGINKAVKSRYNGGGSPGGTDE